jgi:dipeptidase E
VRLYLSSFRLGNHADRLLSLVGSHHRAAVVGNAADAEDGPGRADRLRVELAALREVGLEPAELDLRDFFPPTPPEQLHHALSGAGLLWVRGGNTFVLRQAMRHSGADHVIVDLLRRDTLAYGGYSAGVVVLGPSLRGIELVDDPSAVGAGHPPGTTWDGLGLLPYAVAPHHRSDHPASPAIDRLVAHYTEEQVPHRTLRDGQVILIDGPQNTLLN